MVVLSEVKRLKRTAIGGIGARGRRARYSCWKMGTKSGGTANLSLTQDAGLLWLRAVLTLLILVEVEVVGLLGEQSLGLVGKVLTTLDGFFSREIKTRFAR